MWPNKTGLDDTHLDAGKDNPGLARAAILAMLRAVIALIDSRGVADGVCELNAQAKVPAGRIDKGVAGGICELDKNGLVPTARYGSALAGKGLSKALDGKIVHGNTSSVKIAQLQAGHIIKLLEFDEFGHVTNVQSGVTAFVERMASTSTAGILLPDPEMPAVGLAGTWVVIIDEITTSQTPASSRTYQDGEDTITKNYRAQNHKTRRVIYAKL